MKICGYGCGRQAKYSPKKGMTKWCCESHYLKCPGNIRRISYKKENHPNFGKKLSKQTRNKISKKISFLAKNDEEYKRKQSLTRKSTIKQLIKKYPLFSKIEEMRYNPDKPGEKEIQVHCKNHNCPNSKEKEGWFTPTYIQFYERIRQIEKIGNDGCYFYCCNECKIECPLFNLISDPNKNKQQYYTQEEYQTWRTEVLKRADYKCEYCGEDVEHAHHIIPQKINGFFSLDPDYGIACCEKCHYKKGHKDECSTGQLTNTMCT